MPTLAMAEGPAPAVASARGRRRLAKDLGLPVDGAAGMSDEGTRNEQALRASILGGMVHEQRRQAETAAALTRLLEGDPSQLIRQLRVSLAREIAALEDVVRICEAQRMWRGIAEVPGRLERWAELERDVRRHLEWLRAQHELADRKLRAPADAEGRGGRNAGMTAADALDARPSTEPAEGSDETKTEGKG